MEWDVRTMNVMVSQITGAVISEPSESSCGVCSRGVPTNSFQCTSLSLQVTALT